MEFRCSKFKRHSKLIGSRLESFPFAGNYSAYGFEIIISRSLGPFILSVYLPSAMFVMMSWVSFFVPPVGMTLKNNYN